MTRLHTRYHTKYKPIITFSTADFYQNIPLLVKTRPNEETLEVNTYVHVRYHLTPKKYQKHNRARNVEKELMT